MKKYSLTNNKIEVFGKTLFQIKAEMSLDGVVKGELGGYIEAEANPTKHTINLRSKTL